MAKTAAPSTETDLDDVDLHDEDDLATADDGAEYEPQGLVLGDIPDVLDLPESERVLIFTDRYGDEHWCAKGVPLGVVMEYKRLIQRDRDSAYSTLIADLLGEDAWEIVRRYGPQTISDVVDELLVLFPKKGETRPNRGGRSSRGRGRSKR